MSTPVRFAPAPSEPGKGSNGKEAIARPQPLRPGAGAGGSQEASAGPSSSSGSPAGKAFSPPSSGAGTLVPLTAPPHRGGAGALHGGQGSAGQTAPLSFEMLEAAYTAAKDRVATTEASKREVIAQFKLEMGKSQAAQAADEFSRQLKRWTERIAELDSQIAAAQHQVDDYERSRELVQEAYELQQLRAQASARAKKSSDALRLARIKYDEALAEQQVAAERLVSVHGRLRQTSPELVRMATQDGPETRELMARLKSSGARAQAGILGGPGSDDGGSAASDPTTAAGSVGDGGGGNGSRAVVSWDSMGKSGDEREKQSFYELLRSPFERTLRGPSGRVYTGTAFGLLIWMPPRRHCILLVENKVFENLILFVILMNSASMAWESPLDPCCTWKAQVLDYLEVCVHRRPAFQRPAPRVP